jgi:phenylalanine-4-hydroxylase
MIKDKNHYISKLMNRNGDIAYSDEENEIWSLLLTRQKTILKDRACQDYLQGMELLNLPEDRIPQLSEMNRIMKKHSLWRLVPVSSLIPADAFFTLLAQRKFPVATFIRRREDLDYIAEPDIFHEIVGHCPLLMHTPYADFLQSYGRAALQATQDTRQLLERLFFFTIETGLVRTPTGLRIYGGGILSSYGESLYALDSTVPERKEFNRAEIEKTEFSLEKMQSVYYVIENFDSLYHVLEFVQSCYIKGSILP